MTPDRWAFIAAVLAAAVVLAHLVVYFGFTRRVRRAGGASR